jgi:type II secretory pathway predicted ATPase ExeA
MYETYYQLKTKPFTLLPDPEFLYLGAKHKMALSLLEYGLANGSALIVIAGDPGTGKTTLLNRLLDETRHPWTVGVLSNTHVGIGGLLPWIAASFDLSIAGKSDVEAFHEFTKFLEREWTAGRRVLLVVDEAQNIGATMLEELRLLSNLNDGRRRSLQILLSGQLGLWDLLKGPGMVQFAQRIGVEYTLDALSEEETLGYMTHRLEVAGRCTPLFTTLAGRSVFRLTGGTPRLINQLCDYALVYGFAKQAEIITVPHVLETAVARDRHGVFPFKVSPGSVEWSPGEFEEERVEVETFQTRNVGNPEMDRSEHPAETQDPVAIYKQAVTLRETGDHERALALLDLLAEQEPWVGKALAQKGLCLKDIGRGEEAISMFQHAIDRPSVTGEDRAALQYMLGRTFEEAGRIAEAVATYRLLQQSGRSYRDVEERLGLGRVDATGRMERAQQTGDPPASWVESLFRVNRKGYVSAFRGERSQRFFNLK